MADEPAGPIGAPAAWVTAHLPLLRPGGLALDVACGRGRHALALAAAGLRVHAVDRDAGALEVLRGEATRLDLSITREVRDLETDPPPDLGDARYDAIVVMHYLHRPLFPALLRALAPGGVLLYETFTTAQAARGTPTNPAFLLRPGELPTLAGPLRVLDAREGEFEGRCVASIAARRDQVPEPVRGQHGARDPDVPETQDADAPAAVWPGPASGRASGTASTSAPPAMSTRPMASSPAEKPPVASRSAPMP
jgi:SAM-dependent methyltransferase